MLHVDPSATTTMIAAVHSIIPPFRSDQYCSGKPEVPRFSAKMEEKSTGRRSSDPERPAALAIGEESCARDSGGIQTHHSQPLTTTHDHSQPRHFDFEHPSTLLASGSCAMP
ncbi:hypothetical protein E2P81_ATG02301 [Venturia nashicola]|nr:hypothetical protein E2P81_ATG02301 [Venturia nashicola]